MKILFRVLLAFTLCGVLAARAQQPATGVDCIISSAQDVAEADGLPLCDALYPADLYVEDDSPWRVGIGAGYGQRSNPLINSDDIPLYAIVQLSYFGERFFFDNGDVGAFLAAGDGWQLNLVAGVGGERSFFSYANDSPVNFVPGSGMGNHNDEPGQQGGVEAPDRDYAVDGGLELLYDWRGMELQLQALTDISDRHNGQELWLSVGRPLARGRWAFNPSVGLTWLGARTADYYYGVRRDEAAPGLPAYEANASLNYFARVSLAYRFNRHWQLAGVLQYERLGRDIRRSPSVEDDAVTTSFLGLYYEF